jgi:xanthine dehydrogenase iron-sulfur cluster and FAD-binding subunit A
MGNVTRVAQNSDGSLSYSRVEYRMGSTVDLLKRNPHPTRDECREELAGNLCRCGAYDNYLNGVMRAAGPGSAA